MSYLQVLWDQALSQGLSTEPFSLKNVARLIGSPPPGWDKEEVRQALLKELPGPWVRLVFNDVLSWSTLIDLATERPDWESSGVILEAERKRTAHYEKRSKAVKAALLAASLPCDGSANFGAVQAWDEVNPPPPRAEGPWVPLDLSLDSTLPDNWFVEVVLDDIYLVVYANDSEADMLSMDPADEASAATIQEFVKEQEEKLNKRIEEQANITHEETVRLIREQEHKGRLAMETYLSAQKVNT